MNDPNTPIERNIRVDSGEKMRVHSYCVYKKLSKMSISFFKHEDTYRLNNKQPEKE